MFQFSSLLTRPEADQSRRRVTVDKPTNSPHISTDETRDTDFLRDHCVSDRVRQHLDEQMQRLADLLNRVESQEFDQEASTADIFSMTPDSNPPNIKPSLEVVAAGDK